MSEYTSCPVCFETFDSRDHLPLILSCGHTICKSSLRSILSTSSQLLCPLDRKPEARPISRLPKNILILQIAEQGQAAHAASVQCRNHEGRQAEFRCEDCSAPYCSKCIVKQHQHHRLVEIDNESGQWTQKLQSVIAEVKEDYQLCKKAFELAVSHHALAVQEEARLKDRLKADFEALRQILAQKEDELRRSVSEKCESQVREAANKESELAEEMRLIASSLETAKNFEEMTGSGEEIRAALQEIATKRHFLSTGKMSLPTSPSLSLALNISSVQSAISSLEWRPREPQYSPQRSPESQDTGVGPLVPSRSPQRVVVRPSSPTSEEDDPDSERVQCTYCNRAFASDRIHVHVEACRKVMHRRVQPMDFSQRRRAAFK